MIGVNGHSSNRPRKLSIARAPLAAAIGGRVCGVLFALRIRRAPLAIVLDGCAPDVPPSVAADPALVARIVRYVDVYRRVLRLKCLERSIVLCDFLRRAGLPVTLNLGIRRLGDTVQGHAWLSLGEEIVFERGDAVPTYQCIHSRPVRR